MKAYEAIAASLVDLDVKHLFGLIGDANLFMVDHYIRECQGKYTRSVNEAGVVMMGLGYARVTGEIGVATVTHGPALTNALTALVEGVKTATPLVLLAGDTAVADREHAQNVNQREFINATGAGFVQWRTPQTLADDLARAFYRARLEHRPVVFNMPADFMWQDVEYVKPRLYFPEARSAIHTSRDMDHAIGIIASSHRPVVLGGRGAADAQTQEAILRFARRIEAPVTTTVRGKGLFADDPFNLGLCGTVSNQLALEIIGNADCLISFGASLTQFTSGLGGLTRGKRIIQINSLASQIGRFTQVDIGLVGDPGLTADAMVKWLDEAEIPGSGYRSDDLAQKITALRQSKPKLPRKSRDGTVDLFEMLSAVDQAVPANRVYVTDTGRFLLGAWPLIRVQSPYDYVDTIGFSAIGLGLPAAVGAAVGAGDRPTLFIAGDGGFMLGGVSELATVIREQLNMIIIICNDGGYGAEYVQYTARDMDPALSLQHWPDFSEIARGFGMNALTVENSDDLEKAIEAIGNFDTTSGSLLIDVRIDPAAMPEDVTH